MELENATIVVTGGASGIVGVMAPADTDGAAVVDVVERIDG